MTEAWVLAEDAASEVFVSALARRVAKAEDAPVLLRSFREQGGFPAVRGALRRLDRSIARGGLGRPQALIVAIDANCHGVAQRRQEILDCAGELADCIVPAIADPHIERWFLLDGHAFKQILGQGCKAPDHKCEADRYKRQLLQAIVDSGVRPLLGGIEYAQDLAELLDLDAAARLDAGLELFLKEWRAFLRRSR